MPKGFIKIPNIKGDMAQKLFTMYGAHDHAKMASSLQKLKPNFKVLCEYFSMPFWLIIDNNGPYPQ